MPSDDHQPIQKEYHDKMNVLANVLDAAFNPSGESKIVFSLFMAEVGNMEGGRVNYISNGKREDMLNMVKEWLGRAEKVTW